jgi:hypothetical protein
MVSPSLDIRLAPIAPLVLSIEQPDDQAVVHLPALTLAGTMNRPAVVTVDGMETQSQIHRQKNKKPRCACNNKQIGWFLTKQSIINGVQTI